MVGQNKGYPFWLKGNHEGPQTLQKGTRALLWVLVGSPILEVKTQNAPKIARARLHGLATAKRAATAPETPQGRYTGKAGYALVSYSFRGSFFWQGMAGRHQIARF